MKKLITIRETARKLGCTRKYVYDLVYEGRFKGARKLGRSWVIPEASVEAVTKKQHEQVP